MATLFLVTPLFLPSTTSIAAVTPQPYFTKDDQEVHTHQDPSGTWVVNPPAVSYGSNYAIVTTKNSLASLYDDNGNKIENRSLASKTPWATDKFREYGDTGEIQYRVSTHEWVSENDIFSRQNLPEPNKKLVLQNITPYDDPADFPSDSRVLSISIGLIGKNNTFTIYRTDGTPSGRRLSGDTMWKAGASATGNDGKPYYRISKDEWIKGDFGTSYNESGAWGLQPATGLGGTLVGGS